MADTPFHILHDEHTHVRCRDAFFRVFPPDAVCLMMSFAFVLPDAR